MFIAQFLRPAFRKKINLITVIVWVLRRVEKMSKKGKKMSKIFFLDLKIYQSVKHQMFLHPF